MSAFDRYLQDIIDRAGPETARDRSTAIEAHHLLLAIATERGGPAHDVLATVGLDHDWIVEALNREYAASLNAAGVCPDEERHRCISRSIPPQQLRRPARRRC